jgi:integrase
MVWALAGLSFKHKRGDIAVALLLAFEGLLRTGELTSLQKSDIDVAKTFSSAVLNLGFTKTGSRIGSQESVTIEDPDICRILAARLLNLKPGDLLLPKGSFEFRRFFKQLVEELKLQSLGFKPYSLRRGGATHHFRTCGQLSKTVVKGRWTNARTARVYINEGLAVLATFSCPESDEPITENLKHFLACTKVSPHPDL